MAYLNITLRVISIMALALFLTLITGRRKIGELPVFDFLVVITIGQIIGADIADPQIPHLPTAYALILVLGIHYLYTFIILKNRKVGKIVTFEPVVVIENGQFVKSGMKKTKFTLDNILMMLREKEVFDPSEVEFAIIESNGNLSVLKKAQKLPLTPYDIKLNTNYRGLSVPLIVEGSIYDENLDKMNLDRNWLMSQLKASKINSADDVFYASINTEGKLYISKGVENNRDIHDLRH